MSQCATQPAAAPPPPPDVLLRLDYVTKRFGDRTVLDDVCLDIRRGERLVIIGGSGSGKSTLLNLMIGELRADGGQIVLGGRNLCALSEAEIDEYRRMIGVSFQSGALFNSMTVAENVALPLREHTDLDNETIDIIVKMKLELVGLRGAADRLPAELSGGMRKRAGIARAIALDPHAVFYDEPSAGLDPITVARLDELIIRLNETANVTSVIITHEMTSAFRIAHRMALLHDGKIVAIGTPDEMQRSADPLVHQFVNGLTQGPFTDRSNAIDYTTDLLGALPHGSTR